MTTLLTAAETAEILRVNKVTVYRWAKAGQIPSVRLPSGDVRFRQAELEKWIDSRSRKPRRG